MDQLLERLKLCRSQYLEGLAAFPEEKASVKPAGGGWSMLECAEHVALVEFGLFRRITSQSTPLREEAGRHREALFLAHGLDRTRKISAPEPAQPSGRFTTLAEAGEAFAKYRGRTIGWVETCGENLRLRSIVHPAMGTMTAYECLILMSLHPLRHLEQMRELA
uniref:DinB-like domain-containing protein n=1 Tax=Solibacter usitatus (strain Ellin6076) TaxID=234267 RepID=Q01Q13_SOLUE